MIEPGLLLFGAFVALPVLGAPIVTALGVTALVFLWQYGLGLQASAANVYANIAKFPLLAIPFFILAGFVMERAGLSRSLVKLLNLLIGPVPGGLALVAVGGCVFFGAISGTGPADTAAIGSVMIPAMVRRGYSVGFAAAVVAAAATTDVLIPQSVAFVVYGTITQTSVSRLRRRRRPGPPHGRRARAAGRLDREAPRVGGERWGTPAEIRTAVWEAKWGLLAPVVVLGGIYGGVFTPTEAAVVAVAYGLFVGAVVSRSLAWRDLFEVFRDSAVSSSVVMIVVALAGLFSWTGSRMGVMDRLAGALLGLSDNGYVLLLLVNLLVLVADFFLDAISIYFVFLPILIPIMQTFGWDPVWFGVVLTLNLAICTITPPIAVNLYVASNISGASMEEVSRWVLPFFLALIAVLLPVMFVPGLALWLPNALGVK